MSPGGGRTRLVIAAIVALTVLAVSLALWLLRTSGAEGSGVAGADAIAVPGGYVVMGEVSPEVLRHPKGMPASMMPDPVPEGFERVAVEVTLLADSDAALALESSDLTLSGPGVEPVAPVRDTIGDASVPAGAELSGSVLFEVPADAKGLRLGVADGEGTLPITVPAGVGHQH